MPATVKLEVLTPAEARKRAGATHEIIVNGEYSSEDAAHRGWEGDFIIEQESSWLVARLTPRPAQSATD